MLNSYFHEKPIAGYFFPPMWLWRLLWHLTTLDGIQKYLNPGGASKAFMHTLPKN
jgi:hypothetical protein